MIAVLGAGISGLTIAYKLLKAGKKVILLEKSAVAGGKIQSFQANGFTGELGPNTVLLNNPEFLELLKDLDLFDELILPEKSNINNRYILFEGKIEALPKSIGSLIKSPLIGRKSLSKVASELFINRNNNKESLADLCRRHFGDEIYENFIVPMVTGIYAGDPEKMDADHVLPFLKNADRETGSIIIGAIKNKKKENHDLPKQKIFTFEKGLQYLPQKLAEELGESLQLGAKVETIEKINGKYTIGFKQNSSLEKVEVDKVISTLPIPDLENLNSAFQEEFSKLGQNIHYVPVTVLHFGYEKQQVGFQKKAFGLLSRPQEKMPFLAILFNSRFFPHTAPVDKELMTIICGGGLNPEITDLSDEAIIEQVENSLKSILAISSAPSFIKVTRWKNAIPQYYWGYDDFLKSVSLFQKKHSGFYFAGNYLKSISVSDCVKNAVALSEKILDQDQ